ncbi:hypothetical protein EXE48_12785 [Halorubrum sp. ASP1]|uniref:hypothetical protein n=1 Tax=Halorubrum sp. ASP1 TaxID=2518114 RepID=UPI0010F82E62|nr:hypothetical protein [Halorubrum sp. ASP1]TKX60444.1 hypothetical protein EXE48_12785 [Halorubrum sp. ASP1]
MTDSELFDNTRVAADHVETPQPGQDYDASNVSTADVNDAMARSFVSDLIDNGIVVPISGTRALLHKPSHTAFDSITQ